MISFYGSLGDSHEFDFIGEGIEGEGKDSFITAHLMWINQIKTKRTGQLSSLYLLSILINEQEAPQKCHLHFSLHFNKNCKKLYGVIFRRQKTNDFYLSN